MSAVSTQPVSGFSGRRLALVFTVPVLDNPSLFQVEFDHVGRVLGLRLLHRAEGLAHPDMLEADVIWLGQQMRLLGAIHMAQQLGGHGVLGRLADEVHAIERDSKVAVRDAYNAIDRVARRRVMA